MKNKSYTRKGSLFAKPLSATISKVTKPIMKKHGLPDGLVTSWPQIMGMPMANMCLPVACKRSKKHMGATLVLEVMPAHSLMVQHSSGVIKEKINMHYGYEAISRIQCQPSTRSFPMQKPPPSPQAQEMDAAFEALSKELTLTAKD